MSFVDHYAREAMRLRVIIESLAFVEPHMSLEEAVPIIFKIEEQTFEREVRQLPSTGILLDDNDPETLARFIDMCPAVRDLVRTKKINAIKELRSRVIDADTGTTMIGLKDAKDGVEHWDSTRPKPWVPPARSSSTPPRPVPGLLKTPADVADWIDTDPTILATLSDAMSGRIKYGKIQAIKDVRAASSIGLKEAKEGVEEWIRTRHPGASWPSHT